MQLKAQSYVEIGSGTVSTSYPVYSVWNYGWYSFILPQSEAGAAKTINSIAFDCTNGPKNLANQKIYMKNSANSTFADASYENPVSNGYTLVYNGTINYDGWTIINLSTPFEYNGTDNLIIHYENYAGNLTYANFNSTYSTSNNNKGSGSDTGFPTSAGYLNPYPSSIPNTRLYYASTMPATPDNPSPINTSEKIDLNTQLSFSIGENTTAYDIYLSSNTSLVETLDPAAKVASDISVSAPGTFFYTPGEILTPSTEYFWRIVAKDASNSTNGNVWSFNSQNVISVLPYNQGFEGDDIFFPGWYGQYTDWSYPATGADAIWNKSGEANANSGTAALTGAPFSGSIINSPIMTPRIFLPDNSRVSFVWRNGNTNKTAGNDTTFFEISIDGAQSWTKLNTLSPETAQNEYVTTQSDLSVYAGNNVYLRWRYVRNNTENSTAVYIDDFILEQIPNGAVMELSSENVQFADIALFAHNKKTVEITNKGSEDLIISEITVNAPFFASVNINPIPAGDTAILSITLEGNETGNLSENLTIISNATGNSTISLSGNVLGLSTDFFYTFESIPEYSLPENWNKIRSVFPEEIYNDVFVKNSSFDAFSVPNVIKMLNANDSVSPLILLTEGLTNFGTNTLNFYASKTINNTQPVDLIIGLMNDPEDAATFDTVQIISLTDQHQLYTVNFESTNTKPYIAFKHGQNKQWQSIWIDNIEWTGDNNNPPTCASVVFPENSAIDNEADLTLKWTNTSSEVTGYYINFGTNNPPSNIYDNIDLGNINELEINDLDYGTTYYWQIIAYNQYGNSESCNIWSFSTMDDPTLTVPWTQGFEEIIPASGFQYPLGWSVINGNESSAAWDVIVNNATYPENAHSGSQAMNIAFGFMQPLNDWLITPPIELQAGKTYELSFWLKAPVYNDGTTLSHEKLDIFIGNNNTAEALNTQIWNNEFLQIESYEYQQALVNVETTGTYFVGFHAKSDALQWVIMIDDVEMTLTSVGVEKIVDNFKIYPVPAKNEIIISLAGNTNYNAEIYNTLGTKIKSVKLNETTNRLNISNLKSGIYFITITDIYGNKMTQKFIKE